MAASGGARADSADSADERPSNDSTEKLTSERLRSSWLEFSGAGKNKSSPACNCFSSGEPLELSGGTHQAAAIKSQKNSQRNASEARDHDDDDDDDEIERDQMERKNLDSGYAWCILLVMFLLQSSISGASRVYGIVYAQEVALGYYDREQASWPIATASTVENLAGLLTPALANYLSWRQLELLSTLLFIGANALAYASDTLWLDILALGIVQGLALSTSTVLSLAINNDYFERFRTTAYGISMSGSTFGVLYLSPLVSWLLDVYAGNFRVVYLALAIVFGSNILLVLFIKPRSATLSPNGTAAAALRAQGGAQNQARPQLEHSARPSSSCSGSNKSKSKSKAELASAIKLEQLSHGAVCRKISRFEERFERRDSIASISYRTRSRRQSAWRAAAQSQRAASPAAAGDGNKRAALTKSKSGVELARTQSAASRCSGAGSTNGALAPSLAGQVQLNRTRNWTHHQQLCGIETRQQKLTSARSFDRGQTTETTTTMGAQVVRTPSDISREFLELKIDELGRRSPEEGGGPPASVYSLTTSSEPSNETQKLTRGNCEQRQQRTSASAQQQQQEATKFSFSYALVLLRTPWFHCTWIMLALYYLIARIFVIILVDFADDHGFSLKESTNLLNYWSFGELVGRIFLGSLIDLQCLSCKNCIALTCSLLAGAIVTMVSLECYYIYAICSTVVAALISLEYMLINVLMVEYVGKSSVTSCYSLAAFICSAVLFARPTMIGLFRDQLGSYDGLLLLLAGLAFIYALLFYALEPLFVRRWPRPQRQQANLSSPLPLSGKKY